MPGSLHIINARIVNEGTIFDGEVIVRDGKIEKIINGKSRAPVNGAEVVDAKGKYLLPGVIDDQVHFRDPGLTYKADLESESRAAVAGGVTSFMDMPNTIPQTLDQQKLQDKYDRASQVSLANYSFYMGASNDNLDEVLKTDPANVCGLKVFLGASTGNMLVDDPDTLKNIFREVPFLIAIHSEDEQIIRKNLAVFRQTYDDIIPMSAHPRIRSEEACYKSTERAINLAKEYGTRLHVLHLSTASEMDLFSNNIPLKEKKITAEVCVHHLWFSDNDYATKGSLIKWNPAIKSSFDRESLWKALLDDRLDIIATDHAPHTLEEKHRTYLQAPSGGPLVQHSLVAMLDFWQQGVISLEKVVEKMCHAPARCFNVAERGFIREGYWADLVLVDPDNPWKVRPANIYYKCGWSPFDGHEFKSKITHTFVNGTLAYEAVPDKLDKNFNENVRGMRLKFNR